MTGFILYGTDGCHLCEDAQLVLADCAVDYQYLDIMQEEIWQQRYGLLIPVLCHEPTQSQLNWPFSAEQVRQICRGDYAG